MKKADAIPESQPPWLNEIEAEWRARPGGRANRGASADDGGAAGVFVLFAGPNGTGKTMAAELLASRLHLGLYRVDAAALISKYIGETEKNLKRVFDEAERAGSLLFLDEADALFGRRTDVKDSHDRYGNVEVAYLLQRMEAFHGMAILAASARRNIDAAFLRRLRHVVQFPRPVRGGDSPVRQE